MEFQEDVFEEIDKETELHEMRSMDIVQMAEPGNVLALFSPPNALELIYSRGSKRRTNSLAFELIYSSKVIESCITTEDVFNHFIDKATASLSVQY